MKYFEKLKVRLCQLGIFYWNYDSKSKKIVIATRCGFFIIFISFVLTTAYYLLFETQTHGEYSKTLLFLIGSVLIVLWYFGLIFQNERYTAIFDEVETIIETSKLLWNVNAIQTIDYGFSL